MHRRNRQRNDRSGERGRSFGAHRVSRAESRSRQPPTTTQCQFRVCPAGNFNRPQPADVTILTRDLALLLKAGARLDDGLELLARDRDIGRLSGVVKKIHAEVVAGESFAEALSRHPQLFPPIYVALVQVGEASGKLAAMLEIIGNERARAEALRRKLMDALQYPAFVLVAAVAVMVFFTMFVLPQFSAVLRDFGAKTDSVMNTFFALSDFGREHAQAIGATAATAISLAAIFLRRPFVRVLLISELSRLPGLSQAFTLHRAALFCRNLGILLSSDVALTTSLRILVDIMSTTGRSAAWAAAADRVRHGKRLSDALAAADTLPPMAVRMMRLGEETGQLPALLARVAEFYEAKLQRSLDKMVGIVGPLAIIFISVVVGGLIVSVMTALLSVTQVVG